MLLTKISALRDPIDIEQVSQLLPTYVSFDFMPLSERYFGEADASLLWRVPHRVRKTGRFAGEQTLRIVAIAGKYGLTTIQLDGSETPQECEQLSAEGLEVLKTITDETFAFTELYEGVCNRFVFRFDDPALFSKYTGRTPFIVETPNKDFEIEHPMFSGVDCGQQGYEISVGCKDVAAVEQFIESYKKR